MSLLEMKHIKKEFGGMPVIRDISLSVEQGEILAIIGPSGSGKSTLLRCATMLETIDDGEILYLGKRAAWVENGKPAFPKKQEMKEIQSCFGLVFQNFNLFPHFSVIKNITDAPIRVQKREKEEVYEEAKKLLTKMGLADKADAYPYQLSGGQRQRTAAARAIITRPALVLADEPTGALDSKSARLLLDRFEELNGAQRTTILMVTHDAFTASCCHRVIFLRDGQIFLELSRGGMDRRAFFAQIIRVVSQLGGEMEDVL